MTQWLTTAGLLAALFLEATAAFADDAAGHMASDKRALAPLQAYVGQWRGVGQLRRGSSRGAWTERSQWSWHFDQGRAELAAELVDGKFFSHWKVQAGDAPGKFVLFATPVDGARASIPGQPLRYEGKRTEDALVLMAADAPDGLPARISVRLVAGGDRMVVLYEQQLGADVYTRLGEVGATRVGGSFAKAVASGPECIVTGGLGTIAVEYQGKKYFVCCTGCRDLFDEDPAGVLAEFHQRKADEKAQQAKPN